MSNRDFFPWTAVDQSFNRYGGENPHYLLLQPPVGGRIISAGDQQAFLNGTSARLIGSPDMGFGLAAWTGSASGSENPLSIVMDGNKALGAVFTPNSTATVGVFFDGNWYLGMNGNGLWESGVDRAYTFGWAGATQVIGDWNGDGRIELGVYQNGAWYLDYNGNGAWDGLTVDRGFGFGLAGMAPVTGDWNGDGRVEIGVFKDGVWYLDYNGSGVWDGPSIDKGFSFGWPGVTPLVGDWTGNGKAKIGVFKDGAWYLDINGNGSWDGFTTDKGFGFGWPGVTPRLATGMATARLRPDCSKMAGGIWT